MRACDPHDYPSRMKTSSFASEAPSLIIDQPRTMKLPELLPPPDTMYRALVGRDSTFEGIFYAGVRTTGIFCRPTCSAKKPARENVDFFATPSEALHGGYRPCMRCHPMDPDKRPPELIERLRAEVERAPGGRLTDKELAALSIDPSTARRQFKRIIVRDEWVWRCARFARAAASMKSKARAASDRRAVFAMRLRASSAIR